jgi:hypothetical protein
MRTTIEFPLALMRAAKAQSATRGESLRALLTRAVEAELGHRVAPATGRRLELPLFGQADAPKIALSNIDLERALSDEDAALVPAPRQVARRRRRKASS